jgi:hypothetical protein
MGLPVKIISSQGSGFLELRDPEWSGAEVASFTAALAADGMEASTGVYVMGGDGLANLFEAMASEWRGWDGVKSWESLEGDLEVAAQHDRLGQITLRIRLRHYFAPPEWEARADLTIDPGEQLNAAARDLRGFFTPGE